MATDDGRGDPRPTVVFVTLGCKANAYDTAALMGMTPADRYRVIDAATEPGPDPADVYVVNTCAVTGQSAFQSRQMVRRARRWGPQATVIATGCLADLEPEALFAAGADHVAGAQERWKVAELLQAAAPNQGFFHHPDGGVQSRGRAVLKVQDGCDFHCAYCVVSRARGPSRSLPLAAALAELEALARRGFAEVVLTGVHLGLYGADLGGSLLHLLQAIDRARLGPRLRLSSLEPQELSDQLLDFIAASDVICPHLHLPLQSGAAPVLARMRRPYAPDQVARTIERAATLIPGLGLGLDLIAGFPGETALDHRATLKLIERLPVTYLHVFPFSRRPGTWAETAPDQLPPTQIKDRARELRELGLRKKRLFLEAQTGRRLLALAETHDRGLIVGTAENYARVVFPGPEALLGKIAPVRIARLKDAALEGELEPPL